MVYQCKKYKWSGYTYSVSAQVVGETCEEIETRQGSLTRENFLESASDEGSPCHKLFEWNNTEAAHKWRLHQAGKILSSLKVEVIEQEKEPVVVRAFLNVNPVDTKGVYMHTERAMQVPEARSSILLRAVRELQIFRDKYETLEELKNVFAAIEEVEEAIE